MVQHTNRRAALAGATCSGLLLVLPAAAQTSAIQPRPDPFGGLLRPVAITQVAGNVANAEALLTGGTATLTWSAGQPAPLIILDYGRDVGGIPRITVSRAHNAPLLAEIFSESRPNLLPGGDGAPGFAGASGDFSRADQFVVTSPRTIINKQVQGGERFEAITLASPGSVRVGSVGITSLTADPAPNPNTGHFASSDPLLNQIWDLGARSLQLCEVPAGSLPPLLTATFDGLLADGASPAIYQYGGGWTDYTASVSAKLLRNEATIVLRPSTFHTLNLTFHASNDRLGKPNIVEVWESGVFGNTPITTAQLPIDLRPGAWHRISANLAGSAVSLSIDGKPVARFKTASTAGSVGFRSPADGAALFRDLSVVATNGTTLLNAPLTGPGVLDEFAAGSNPLPAILDGGKRDRLVWLGDLGLSDATLFYSSGEDQYVAGSLSLLGAFHQPDGEISSNNSPLLNPAHFRRDALPSDVGFYSLPYSIYYVNALAEYVLYSGDTRLLAQFWPAIKGEMAYLAAHTDPSHLIRTTPADGMDWAIDVQTGNATEFNALYMRALQNAAIMAGEMNDPAYAAQMAAQALAVKHAINATLFNAQTGVYDASSDHRGSYAQDANVMAVLYAVATPVQSRGVLAKITARLTTPYGPLAFSDGTGIAAVISPFISGFQVAADFETGDSAGALALIRQEWGPMARPSEFYSGGDFEALGPDGKPQMVSRTLAHGWSTAPTAALSKYVLGVSPTQPGFAQWRIRPQPGDLAWARGQVPTPHGPIAVSWKRESGRFILDATIPRGTSGTISVPAGSHGTLLVDNAGQTGRPAADGYVLLGPVGPGSYHIATE